MRPHSDPWAPLRAMRSDRPGLAVRGARAATFNAGLEQAEQLWRAADVVGPAASPILLFYGLGQAGRALCAAGFRGSSWRPAHSHGLTLDLVETALTGSPTLGGVTVAPEGNGLVQQVATVTDSLVLAGPENLSSLLSSLPDSEVFPSDLLTGFRPVAASQGISHRPNEENKVTFNIQTLPGELIGNAHRDSSPLPPDIDLDRLEQWSRTYPRLHALGRPSRASVNQWHFAPTGEVDWIHAELTWDDLDNPRWTSGLIYPWSASKLDAVISDPKEDQFPYGFFRPAVGRNVGIQSEIIAWWLILYAFSMLARYYPREWSLLLDVNASRAAVPIDRFLLAARDRVPLMVLRCMEAFGSDKPSPT